MRKDDDFWHIKQVINVLSNFLPHHVNTSNFKCLIWIILVKTKRSESKCNYQL